MTLTLKLNADNPLATKVQTRDGRKARIICTDRRSVLPIVALIQEPDGTDSVYCYRVDGLSREGEGRPVDLVNVPEKRVLWINCYHNSFPTTHATMENADRKATLGSLRRTERLCIPYTVGQFDEEPAVTEEGAGS